MGLMSKVIPSECYDKVNRDLKRLTFSINNLTYHTVSFLDNYALLNHIIFEFDLLTILSIIDSIYSN